MRTKRYLPVVFGAAIMLLLLSGCGTKIKVETRETDYVTDTNASVNGYIYDYEEMPARVGIYFGTSEDDMTCVIQDQYPNNVYTSETIDASYDLNLEAEEELEPETTYYYAFYATVDGKDRMGETKSFTTLASDDVPLADVTVTTGEVKDLTDSNATLYAHISDYSQNPDEVGMYLGESENELKKIARDKNPYSSYDFTEYDVWYSVKSDGKMTLEPEMTYYYQAYARIGNAIAKGEVKSFTTTAAEEEEDISSTDVVE